jgi:3-hydroxyisobutyrate dehydrogenase-like beta-hydroxyacid dehydrogenase
MPDRSIGFVGLGIMGGPMAGNLVDAGYEVVGYNRSDGPIEELVSEGGLAGESAADVADRTDVIIMCLPDSAVVESVMHEPDGVIEGLGGVETVIDMSTISPTVTESLARELNELNVAMLDAQVSGGEEGAINGSLSIMIGGDEAVLEEHRSILEVLGGTIVHCVPNGAGQVTKACNQIICAVTYEAVSEALMLAQKAGADLEAVVEATSSGAAGCWALDNRAPRMIEGVFEPGFFAEYQYKDLRIATEAGEAFGAPMPATELAHEMYKSMVENGMGRDDNSGVLQMLELLANEQARVSGE